jgi:hypothetical protein
VLRSDLFHLFVALLLPAASLNLAHAQATYRTVADSSGVVDVDA